MNRTQPDPLGDREIMLLLIILVLTIALIFRR